MQTIENVRLHEIKPHNEYTERRYYRCDVGNKILNIMQLCTKELSHEISLRLAREEFEKMP